MPTYSKDTGSAGEMLMIISPSGHEAQFQIRLKSVISQMSVLVPWAYTFDGQTYWSQTNVSLGITTPQFMGYLAVTKTGTVGFQIGNTDTIALGGPSGIYQTVTIPESDDDSGGGSGSDPPAIPLRVKVKVGTQNIDAVPWVRVNDVWVQAIPWLKVEGRWNKVF